MSTPETPETSVAPFQMPEGFVPRAGLGSGQVSDRCAYQEIRAQMGEDPTTDAIRDGDSPALHAFLITANDGGADLRAAMVPLYPLIVGSRGSPEVEQKRARMALHWLLGTTVRWLKLVQGKHPKAKGNWMDPMWIGPRLPVDERFPLESAEKALLALQPYVEAGYWAPEAETYIDGNWSDMTYRERALAQMQAHALFRPYVEKPEVPSRYEVCGTLEGSMDDLRSGKGRGYLQWRKVPQGPSIAEWCSTVVTLTFSQNDGSLTLVPALAETLTEDTAPDVLLFTLNTFVDHVSYMPNTFSWLPRDSSMGQGWVAEEDPEHASAGEQALEIFRATGCEAAWMAYWSIEVQPRLPKPDGTGQAPALAEIPAELSRPAIEDIIAVVLQEGLSVMPEFLDEIRESAVDLFKRMAAVTA